MVFHQNAGNTMPFENPDDALLLIRCPSCGQRFKVGEDLRGRTVECGGCEHRFRINDEVIVRGKKFYPGERKDPGLNRFQRVPLNLARSTPNIAPVFYQEPPAPSRIEPASPQRVIAGASGAIIMVLMALLLMFGANRGGALDGMTTDKRVLMAAFTGLLGIVLLVYANPKARKKAFFVGLLMAAGVVVIPHYFTVGSVPLTASLNDAETPEVRSKPQRTKEQESLDELRERINPRPLEEELARLKENRSTKHAYGIWLRDMGTSNRYQIRDFIQQRCATESQPIFYPRGDRDFLLLLTGTSRSLDEISVIVGELGTLESVHPELFLIEVKVNNEAFIEGPIEKLTNKNDPAFYDLNKRELECVDMERVNRAVKRLTEAEPKIYRNDISSKLISLLKADWVTFKPDVCSALMVWNEQPGIAGNIALRLTTDLLKSKAPVPKEFVALVVKEKNPGIIPILLDLWKSDPSRWESMFVDFGPEVEPSLIEAFPGTEGALRQSAVRLLGIVGGAASLPVLEGASSSADPELKVLIEKSVGSITARGAR